jgi:tRNA G18 (ribose-2'-O)-methylase SpoU
MATRIESPSNPRIVAAIKAVGAHEKMLLEGSRMIEEALDAGVVIEDIFASEEDFHLSAAAPAAAAYKKSSSPGRLHQQPPHNTDTPGLRVTEVSARVLQKLSDLRSTRGVVAIAAPPHRTLASLSSLSPLKKTASSDVTRRAEAADPRVSETESSLFLLLDEVQDPANVGAILRSGEAFGAAAAVLTPGCAWPYSPRVLRASAASAFRLPVVAGVPAQEAVAWARRHGVVLAGAAAHGGTAPEVLAGVRPLALVIGSEGHGFSAGIDASLEHRVTLPLAGRVESLNAAVAAGVLLHILSRRAASAR